LPIILFLFLISLSSCSWNTTVITPVNAYCPRPQRPTLYELDKTLPINDKKNIELFLKDLNDLSSSYQELEATVKCYEDLNKETK